MCLLSCCVFCRVYHPSETPNAHHPTTAQAAAPVLKGVEALLNKAGPAAAARPASASLTRTEYDPALEAAVNEQIKCAAACWAWV